MAADRAGGMAADHAKGTPTSPLLIGRLIADRPRQYA
jgi:hypothetical protein